MKVREEEVVVLTEHTHAADGARAQVVKIIGSIKRRAEDTAEAPQQILSTGLQNVNPVESAQLPHLHHMLRNIRRQHQKAGSPIAVPQTRAEIPEVLPVEYTTTAQGHEFVLYDSHDVDRILVFGTQHGLQLLRASQHMFIDGTFATVPSTHTQLFTIHVLYGENPGSVVPMVYALLPDKQTATYQRVFTALGNDIHPTTVMMDFERAEQVLQAIVHCSL